MIKEFLIQWYDLKDTEILYLDTATIKELIDKGISRAGNLSKLCLQINSLQLYKIVKANEGISVKVLKRLLDYAQVDYSFINNMIREVRKGNIASIQNPKFPIDLTNPIIGDLAGHLMSDGCLYYDLSRKNLIRTKYCSDEQEAIALFVKNMNELFGETHYNREFIRNCIQIRFGNSIVGEVFRIAGVTVGKKYKVNGPIPSVVKDGCLEMKRQYLRAIFDDEGSVGNKKSIFLILSRSIHVDFTKEEKEILSHHIVPLMKRSFFPTGHSNSIIRIRAVVEILKKMNENALLEKLLNSKPNLLIDESNMLREYFGIINHIYVISLHLTHNGSFSLQSCILISKKQNVLKFYEQIGFSSTKKQNKLIGALTTAKLITSGTYAI